MSSIPSHTYYANDAGKVTVICQSCGFAKEIDMKKLKISHKTLKVKCKCGEVFSATIEFRKYYRKKVNLPGKYRNKNTGKSGDMVVENISLVGVGFSILPPQDNSVNDFLALEFQLDNQTGTRIGLDVEVKSVEEKYVGCKILDVEQHRADLGFYLKP